MPAFEYTALDARGRERNGVIEGETARAARSLLRERGLVPTGIEAVTETGSSRRGLRPSRWQTLNATETALVTRQLATLISAGLPVDACLSAVIRQADNARIRRILTAVRARVLEGQTLAQGLAAFPRAFSDLYRATIAAGEESGHLDTVLDRLADYTENRQATGQRMQMALFYPALLTLMAVAVVVALVTYVVPQVVQVFDQMDQTLPLLTRILIAISDFLRHQWPWLIAALAAATLTLRWLLARPGPRERWARLILRLPLLGRLIRGFNAARFARTLSILSAAGVPMLRAMKISAEVLSSPPMRQAVVTATDRVREGEGIAHSLERSRLFPPMVIQLIAAGEQSGSIDRMLQRAAEQQERELDTLISGLLGLFEPLLIVIMGMVVLVIVLAILVPIFDLNQMIQ